MRKVIFQRSRRLKSQTFLLGVNHGHHTDFNKLVNLCPVKKLSLISTPGQSLFLNKHAGQQTGTLLKRDSDTLIFQRIVLTFRNSHFPKHFMKATFKGCVCFIFAGLFLSLNKSPCQTRKFFFYISLQKLFSFSWKSNFRILNFQIWWRHQMPKHKAKNTFLLNNVGNKQVC